LTSDREAAGVSRKRFDADQFIERRTSYPEQTRAINIPPNIPIARRDPGFPRAGVSPFARARPHGRSKLSDRPHNLGLASTGSLIRESLGDNSVGGARKIRKDSCPSFDLCAVPPTRHPVYSMAHQQWDWSVREDMPRHTTEKALSQPTVGVSAHHDQRGLLLARGGNQGCAGGVLVLWTDHWVRSNAVPGKIFGQIRGIDIVDVKLGRGKD
jgi:hypothetical protein